MLLHTKNEAIRHINERWAGLPEAGFGVKIIELIAENLITAYFPMNRFLEFGDRKYDLEITKVVTYLIGSEMHLLDLRLEFIEDEYIRFLDNDEAKAATEDQVHPLSGELDPHLDKKLFLNFTPSALARNILSK